MKKYRITVEIDAEYIPSDVMDELTDNCIAQLESLNDGSLNSNEDLKVEYKATAKWEVGEVLCRHPGVFRGSICEKCNTKVI